MEYPLTGYSRVCLTIFRADNKEILKSALLALDGAVVRIRATAQIQGSRATVPLLRYAPLTYGWPKWTKSVKGSTYEKFHVRKHPRIKNSGIKRYAYQKFRV